ncbi:MAG: GNAT family N-acetyltransferase [Methylophaga sp.]|nr:GNAT family N-acetyltransferase [Methylophaga sp.]
MLTIEQAQIDDMSDVFMLAKKLATSYEVNRLAFNKSFNCILNDPKEVVFITKHDQSIIGNYLGTIHTTFFANGAVAWLEELYVKPDYRGFGTGMTTM